MHKKLVVLSVLVLIVSACLQPMANAHFFIEDSSTGLKSYFHVTPDHDPLAGEESVISYDFSKSSMLAKDFTFSLRIKDPGGIKEVSVPLVLTGNVIIANYAFPYQGLYRLTLEAKHKETAEVSQLKYSQRVSRGTLKPPAENNWLLWAVIVSGSIVLVVVAILFERRSYTSSKNKHDI